MINPEMNKMMKNVKNRYLLVNLAAARAREIALEAERDRIELTTKPVRLALDEIARGDIVPTEEALANAVEEGEAF